MKELEWDTILDYIEAEQAALLIGPDVMYFDGEPMNVAVRNSLKEKLERKIDYYYPQDHLFLFGRGGRNDAALHVRNYLNRREPDEETYKKIVQLKLPLVISMTPDTFLSDIAYKFGVRHRFSYFRNRNKANEDIEDPSIEVPLYYNLCGSKNDDESIILTYEDLFQLIASSITTPGLPAKLQIALKKVRTFIFLGFEFEKWYTQLLMRLLCGEEESRKYAIDRKGVDNEVRDFLVNQFQVEFLEKEDNFLDQLYKKCGERGLLRTLTDPASNDEINIIRQIQTGRDLNKPLHLLHKKTEGMPLADDVTLLMATYNHLQEDRKKGIIDGRDYSVQYNKLIDGILTLTRASSS